MMGRGEVSAATRQERIKPERSQKQARALQETHQEARQENKTSQALSLEPGCKDQDQDLHGKTESQGLTRWGRCSSKTQVQARHPPTALFRAFSLLIRRSLRALHRVQNKNHTALL